MRGSSIWLALGLVSSIALAAEPGVTDKAIVIGQSISLDQGKNSYGVAAAQGVKLYIDKVNAEGGVHGRKIVLKVLDDQSKAANAAANARQLLADGAFILFGSIATTPPTSESPR